MAEDVEGLIDAMADSVVVVGWKSELIYANRTAEERFGVRLDEVRGQALADWVHPDDAETALLSLVSVAQKDIGTPIEVRIRDRSGQYASFEVRGRRWHAGPEGAVILNLRETTYRRVWELAEGDLQVLGTVLDHLPVVTLLLDADGTLRSANRALTRLVHRSLESLRGGSIIDLVRPDEADHVRAELTAAVHRARPVSFETHFVNRNGRAIPLSVTIVDLLADRAVRGLVAVAWDISPLVEVRRDLRHLADHDDLTGLPNRASLRDHIQTLIDASGGSGSHTLLFGDVDGLKAVNDHFGHRAGDAVLSTIAARLQRAVRPGDFIARLGGDEFVLVIASTDPAVIQGVERRIEDTMASPIALPDGHRVTITISVGAAPIVPSVSANELLDAADAAMYIAKRERRAAQPDQITDGLSGL